MTFPSASSLMTQPIRFGNLMTKRLTSKEAPKLAAAFENDRMPIGRDPLGNVTESDSDYTLKMRHRSEPKLRTIVISKDTFQISSVDGKLGFMLKPEEQDTARMEADQFIRSINWYKKAG